jgi:hypothetical protein
MKRQFVPKQPVRKFCTNIRTSGETYHPLQVVQAGQYQPAGIYVPVAHLCPMQHSHSSEQNVHIQQQISFYFIQSTVFFLHNMRVF